MESQEALKTMDSTLYSPKGHSHNPLHASESSQALSTKPEAHPRTPDGEGPQAPTGTASWCCLVLGKEMSLHRVV